MLGSKAADLSFRDRIDGAWPGADGTPFIIDPANPRHYVIQLFRRLERCGVPVIARVNGHALAGGLGLVCVCDMAVHFRQVARQIWLRALCIRQGRLTYGCSEYGA